MPKPALVERLLSEIEAIPFVDSHTHVPLPSAIQEKLQNKRFKYDVPYLLGACTYVAQFMAGKDWREVRKRVAVNAHHAYYRPMIFAMRDLYGLGKSEELSDANVKKISDRMNSSHRDPKWYGEVMRRANVRHILWMDWNGKDLHKLPVNRLKSTTFHPVWNVDWSIYFYGKKPKKGEPFELEAYAENFGKKPKSLDDLEAMHDASLRRFFANGGVSLKSTSSYFRPLDFNVNVPRAKAAAAFKKVVAQKPLTLAEQRDLQDYSIVRFLRKAAKRKAPFQFHTGNQQNWNTVEDSNPLKLNALLLSGEFKDAKFVLLHGGYPYTQQSIMLAKYFPGTVYLDLTWMSLFSPAAAKQTLSQALDMLDGAQVMFGTDTANFEEFYGTVKITRRVVADVVAEKVESGLWTEKVALEAAKRILNKNAIELYGLAG
jgi:predicted TIM-barrel fold metal-dependent hydrolase